MSIKKMFSELSDPKLGAEGQSQPPFDTPDGITKPESLSTKMQSVPDTTLAKALGNSNSVQIKTKDEGDDSVPVKLFTKLISNPSIESTFQSGGYSPALVCVGSGLAWVRADSRVLHLVDRDGSVKDTINTNFDFDCIALTPQGDILFSDVTNKSVNSISRDKTVTTLFQTEWIPSGLCSLHNGNVAVAFSEDGRVVVFSMSGEVIKELDKKYFKFPYWMANNKVNNDMYITNYNGGSVVAIDQDYNVRYAYKGQGESFRPCDICTDDAGHVLITDWNNESVHILNKDGKFVQYLLTGEQGLENPSDIDVDSEGDAWVGQYESGDVIVVKYRQ